jgi:hypothetical protein
MTNWAERAEQEKRRLATEQALNQQAAANNTARKEQEKQERERIISQKLQLFHQLGIPQTLENCRREVWDGRGNLTPISPVVNQYQGVVGATLSHAIEDIRSLKTIPVYEKVHGTYRRVISSRMSMGELYEHTELTSGPHEEITGEKLAGADKKSTEFSINSSLTYVLGSHLYSLRVAGGYTSFSDQEIDESGIKGFVTSSLVTAAINPPDFRGIEGIAKKRKDFVTANIGKIERSWSNKAYDQGLGNL